VEGDDHGEAYTAILWGVGSSHEMNDDAGAEAVVSVEGNMCGTAMRGSVALPGSKATSRKNGTRRNLGDLTSPATAEAHAGRDGKSRRRSRRGRGEESDGCVVPVKPRTKPTSSRWRRVWREGGRPRGRQAATHAPDSEPDTACHRSCEPTDRRCMGRPSPELRSRPTFGRSPVRNVAPVDMWRSAPKVAARAEWRPLNAT
jgi:hypothetical protein